MIWYSINVGIEPQAESRSLLSFLSWPLVNYVSCTVHYSHEVGLFLRQRGVTLAFWELSYWFWLCPFPLIPKELVSHGRKKKDDNILHACAHRNRRRWRTRGPWVSSMRQGNTFQGPGCREGKPDQRQGGQCIAGTFLLFSNKTVSKYISK